MIAAPRHILLLLLVAFAAIGCDARTNPAAPSRFAISNSTSLNGVTVLTFGSASSIGIADRFTLLVEARDTGSTQPITWPEALSAAEPGKPFPAKPESPEVSDWTVLEVSHATLARGHETMTLVLEPYLAGEKTIPSFMFIAAGQVLNTEPITVTVASAGAPQPNPADPLGALAALGDPLAPSMPEEPWHTSPLAIGLGVAVATFLLVGGITLLVLRLTRRRVLSPDERLNAELTQLRAMVDRDAGPAAEHAIAAFRAWLAATGRVAVGTTGPQLVAWVRSTPASGNTELADRLAAFEHWRFAPAQTIDPAQSRWLIESISAFADALRMPASQTGGTA